MAGIEGAFMQPIDFDTRAVFIAGQWQIGRAHV